MADEKTASKGTDRLAAVVSGAALLLAVIVAQHHLLATHRVLMPELRRLNAELPVATMALVANYPAAFGYLAVVLAGLWLVVTLFLRQAAAAAIINSVLLLAVVLFMVLHGWACVLPYMTLGRA